MAYHGTIVKNEFIVKWRGYHMMERHLRLLKSILGEPCDQSTAAAAAAAAAASAGAGGSCWALVERNNPATMAYPSDFSLVEFRTRESGFEGATLRRLERSRLVSGITPQRMVTREVKGVVLPEEEGYDDLAGGAADDGDGINAAEEIQQDGEGESAESWQLGGHGAGDHVVLPKRRITMYDDEHQPSAHHVTSLFEADALWKKGLRAPDSFLTKKGNWIPPHLSLSFSSCSISRKKRFYGQGGAGCHL